MKILFSHRGILPVKKYGGIERIIYWHMKELIKLGHQVYLISPPETNVENTGIKLIKCNDFDQWHKLIPKSIDIIHLFYNSDKIFDYPLIITMECNGQINESFHQNTIFVSKKHAENHNSSQYIYNGLDFDDYPYLSSKKDWKNFCFLAKGSWSIKNLKDTIKSCITSKKNLNIMGGKKLIPNKFITSYGMVDNQQKLKILRKSDALIFPVRWHEPFGIAIIEAMSQGLPVIGSSYGSIPEIITPDTGVVCETYQHLLTALQENYTFNPDDIRAYVQKHFSITNFSSSYLLQYQHVINGQLLNKTRPCWKLDNPPNQKLSF